MKIYQMANYILTHLAKRKWRIFPYLEESSAKIFANSREDKSKHMLPTKCERAFYYLRLRLEMLPAL